MKKLSRRLRRFFSTLPIPEKGEILLLDQKETHHLKDILRFQIGDKCLVCDGSGREAEAELIGFDRGGEAKLKIQKVSFRNLNRVVYLRLFVSVPHRKKMEPLIEKIQEWGVDELYPLEVERTVIRLSPIQKDKVLIRWRKITQEAVKQSGSVQLTKIHEPLSLEKALSVLNPLEKRIVFHPDPSGIRWGDWIRLLDQNIQEKRERRTSHPEGIRTSDDDLRWVNLFFGPEGGFSRKEMALMEKNGNVRKVHLGQNILKVETAVLGVVSSLRLFFNETSL